MKLFIISHSNHYLNLVGHSSLFSKYNLNELDLGEFQDNQFAENRFLLYLANNPGLIDDEYVGICSASWNKKYFGLVMPLHKLTYIEKDLAPNKVFGSQLAPNWRYYSEASHPGMGTILDDLCSRNNFNTQGTGVWSNNFICHKEVMKQFLPWWKDNFLYCFDKYGFNPPYPNDHDNKRHIAYLLERLAVIYFANSDLQKVQIKKLVTIKA